jgi:hypothetical protein
LAVIVIIPLAYLYQESLEYHEAGWIRGFQSVRTKGFDDFAAFITMYSDLEVMIAFGPLLFHVLNPKKGFKIVIATASMLYVASILNLLYSEARPFWIYGSIKSIHMYEFQCERGYGNPDHHAMI